MDQINPLKKYFRKPGIWVKLPSGGKYYDKPVEDLNEMGEIPIYPMTAKDELLLKNADGLLNGSALTQLISSCAPCIPDPKNMPAVDVDAILVAIRRSTYGAKMEISATHDCEGAKETEYSIDINSLIAGIKEVKDILPVELESGIKVYVRPITLKNILDLNWVQYEQIRAVQMAEQKKVSDEESMKIMQTGYEAISNASINIVSSSIDTVQLPDGEIVNDKAMILDWVLDLARQDYSKLEKTIMTANSQGIDKELTLTCNECGQQYKSPLDMNPTTFFA